MKIFLQKVQQSAQEVCHDRFPESGKEKLDLACRTGTQHSTGSAC
jgi:hypothetical protein